MSKITVTVSGETGSGKSAIAGEIEIALKAIGVPVFVQARDTMVVADYQHWIETYKPEVTIIERNIPTPASRPELALQRRTDPHCQICGRTDKEYLNTAWTCSDPWHADAHLRRIAEREKALTEALVRVSCSLIGALSYIKATPECKKAAASDKIFDQTIKDYEKAVDAAKAALPH